MVVFLSKYSQNYYIVLNILCPSSQPMTRSQREDVNPMPGIPKQYLKRRNSDGRQPICPGSAHRTPHGPCLGIGNMVRFCGRKLTHMHHKYRHILCVSDYTCET